MNKKLGIVVALVRVGLLVAGAVRTVVTDDSRFGRGVYNQVVSYELDYLWFVAENKFEPYRVPANELMPVALSVLAPGESHIGMYGFGAVECMVKDYLKYITTKETIYRPRVSIGAGAGMTYRLNGGEEVYLALQELDE